MLEQHLMLHIEHIVLTRLGTDSGAADSQRARAWGTSGWFERDGGKEGRKEEGRKEGREGGWAGGKEERRGAWTNGRKEGRTDGRKEGRKEGAHASDPAIAKVFVEIRGNK